MAEVSEPNASLAWHPERPLTGNEMEDIERELAEEHGHCCARLRAVMRVLLIECEASRQASGRAARGLRQDMAQRIRA